MWKRLLVVSAVSAAMSSMALAAPLTVGFSQVGSESGWRAAETNVAKSEAEKRGITLKIADGQQKQENQIKAVRSFVAQGVDAIFIAPVVATGWEPVLKEAIASGKPVVIECIIQSDDKVFPMVAPGKGLDEVFDEKDLEK